MGERVRPVDKVVPNLLTNGESILYSAINRVCADESGVRSLAPLDDNGNIRQFWTQEWKDPEYSLAVRALASLPTGEHVDNSEPTTVIIGDEYIDISECTPDGRSADIIPLIRPAKS